jgi:hypothetical protein
MSTVATEYVQSVQEQTLKLIRHNQQAIVDGFKTWAEAVEKTSTELPAAPATDEFPTPQQILQNGFAFAEKLLKTQREFAEGMVAAAEPLVEKLSWKVPAA